MAQKRFSFLSSTSSGNPFQKLIEITFFAFFFLLPLIFYPYTSELFEFNKMIFVYLTTTVIVMIWGCDCVWQKKFVFKRTILDIPLIIFLVSQALSTAFSIDPHTSLFGYYSRWNGGLFSLISYILLYWACVTYITPRSLGKITVAILGSTTIAAVWGIFEHFGHSTSCLLITKTFDVACWVQDVALRVFATFGQPNWMAAWLVAVLPLSWMRILNLYKKKQNREFTITFIVSVLFFVALLFTKSRSGLIAFGIGAIFFWGTYFASILSHKKQKTANFLKIGLGIGISVLIASAVIGTPWTPTLFDMAQKKPAEPVETASGPALETGGTESGDIRKIVWQGAFNVWKLYPIFGSGVETFAYSYYQGRPMAHNTTSEWNFLYNKAHNEYLNYLATTGIVGLMSYLTVIAATLFLFLAFIKRTFTDSEKVLWASAIGAGYISILITNFFGFSVVVINSLFFILPAFFVVSRKKDELHTHNKSQVPNKVLLLGISIVGIFLLYKIGSLWYADYSYAKAINARSDENYNEAISAIGRSIDASPFEAQYHDFLAQTLATVAVGIYHDDQDAAKQYANAALAEMKSTHELSPFNVKLLKSEINSLSDLSEIYPDYLLTTRSRLTELIRLAPTDPAAQYQLALTYAKLGMNKEAIETLNKTISMKPDYKIARRLVAFIDKETGDIDGAKVQLEYILKYISPNDTDIQKELSSLNRK